MFQVSFNAKKARKRRSKHRLWRGTSLFFFYCLGNFNKSLCYVTLSYVTSSLCHFFVMSLLNYVNSSLCHIFVMSVWYVTSLLCPFFVMPRHCYVILLLCYSLLCHYFVMSLLCYFKHRLLYTSSRSLAGAHVVEDDDVTNDTDIINLIQEIHQLCWKLCEE